MTEVLRVRRRSWLTGAAFGISLAIVIGGALVGIGASSAARAESASEAEVSTASYDLAPGTAPFPNLKVKVSQTRDLDAQGIQISWTGGKQSAQPGGDAGGANFLQIFQCWGDDPEHPGHPDRRTCQYGGTNGWGATRDGNRPLDTIAAEDQRYSADLGGYAYSGIPFVGANDAGIVDETKAPADKVISNVVVDATGKTSIKPDQDFVLFNNNKFFTSYTTNEVAWAPSGANGSGSAPFEVQTAMQSPGLGCGNPSSDGTKGQSCWLVMLPRGSADNGASLINTSGLAWDAWQHHLAVKLDFKPLGVRCQIGAAEQQLSGSELLSGALASWQPKLCGREGGSPFVLNQINEGDALLEASSTAPNPMAIASRPLDTTLTGGDDPLVYAPVALAGVSVSVAVDRQPSSQRASADQKSRRGLPLTDIKLTPRILAKLLTASYFESLPSGADRSHIGFKDFSNPGHNARSLSFDPDFLAINDPEWAVQNIAVISFADALQPQGRSDLAQRVWSYIIADPDAQAWLNGEPDPWGMIVNPWYSTNAAINPTGQPLTLPTDSFPKADPIEQADTTRSDPVNGGGPVNLVTYRPYTNDFTQGAYQVLRGDGLMLAGWDRFATPPKYSKAARMWLGSRAVVALSTTPAAARYQTVTAALRNSAGAFVQPTESSLATAAAAMTPIVGQPDVLELDTTSSQAKAATAAYPLTLPVYAALNPRQTDADKRRADADFIRFAARDGQQPGTDLGQLPEGYAPIPANWVQQALAVADVIERGGESPSAESSATAYIPSQGSSALAGGAPAAAVGGTAVAASAAGNPSAVGGPAASLASGQTPADPDIGAAAAVVPLGLVGGAAAAALIPVIGRFGRRRLT